MATINTVKLYFKTDANKIFVVSLDDANTAIIEDGGDLIVTSAATTLMEKQPFPITLSEFKGAEYVTRTVSAVV